MALSNTQRERYARHIALREVGLLGQERLLASRVLVIGAGGLGSPAAMYLAAAGVGEIGLADSDAVDLSNLQRQIIHGTPDLGRPKAVSGRDRLAALNPETHVHAYCERVTAANVRDIIRDRDYGFVIDATDNFAAKFLINDACVALGKPFSHGGILRFRGQAMTYVPPAPGEAGHACYRCVFREPPPEGAVPTAREAGILGVLPGVIGTLQATEAIKCLLGIGELLVGTLLAYDALAMEFRKIPVGRSKDCAACGDGSGQVAAQ